jgi:hypothetical protein
MIGKRENRALICSEFEVKTIVKAWERRVLGTEA